MLTLHVIVQQLVHFCYFWSIQQPIQLSALFVTLGGLSSLEIHCTFLPRISRPSSCQKTIVLRLDDRIILREEALRVKWEQMPAVARDALSVWRKPVGVRRDNILKHSLKYRNDPLCLTWCINLFYAPAIYTVTRGAVYEGKNLFVVPNRSCFNAKWAPIACKLKRFPDTNKKDIIFLQLRFISLCFRKTFGPIVQKLLTEGFN